MRTKNTKTIPDNKVKKTKKKSTFKDIMEKLTMSNKTDEEVKEEQKKMLKKQLLEGATFSNKKKVSEI